MSRIYAICNQKGGVGKTVTAVSLGIGLAREGQRVLLVDVDPQGSLTASLGYQQPDQMEVTLATVMGQVIQDLSLPKGLGILHHPEGVDLRYGGHPGKHHEQGDRPAGVPERHPGTV